MKLLARKGGPVRIETERFVLSTTMRWTAARLSYPWSSDPEVMHPMGYRTKWTFPKWRRNFPRFNNRKRFCFTIRVKETGAVIGLERLVIDTEANASLAVMIGDRSWWGKGVVNETRTALLDYAFGPLGCQRIVGYVIENNYPSIANYHMLGFQCDGVHRKSRRNPRGAGRVDMIVFSMLADEWHERRASQGTP